MEILRAYVSALPPSDLEAFAVRVGTTKGHLRNVMYGFRSCASDIARAIDTETGGAVPRWVTRPDDWYRIWPELIGTKGAPRFAKRSTEATHG